MQTGAESKLQLPGLLLPASTRRRGGSFYVHCTRRSHLAGRVSRKGATVIDVGSATTIELQDEVQVKNSANITGVASLLIAVGTHRLLHVAPGAALELSGLTLANGAAYGVGDADNGGCVGAGATLKTSQTTFTDCVAGFLSNSVSRCFLTRMSRRVLLKIQESKPGIYEPRQARWRCH